MASVPIALPALDEQLPANLLARAEALLASGGRRLLGIIGTPGAGKSTLARGLAQALGARAVVVPMDGFHLADIELARLGRAARKGALDTFDAAGYVALLRRLRAAVPGETVYAPAFHREIEAAIAGEIAVDAALPLVITEGNYLLQQTGPWAAVAELLDESWYVDVPAATRRERLLERHLQHGRDRAAALAWIEHTDEPNARMIERGRERADLVVAWPA